MALRHLRLGCYVKWPALLSKKRKLLHQDRFLFGSASKVHAAKKQSFIAWLFSK